jgi:hypothetical protein
VPASRPTVALIGQDADGKRALYSGAFDARVGPGVTVECSRCGRSSPLSVLDAARTLVPSLHLPVLRPAFPSFVRCPACRHGSWVRFRLRARPVPASGRVDAVDRRGGAARPARAAGGSTRPRSGAGERR